MTAGDVFGSGGPRAFRSPGDSRFEAFFTAGTLRRSHPGFGTPHLATLIQMSLAIVLVLSGTFDEIISYFFFVVVFFVAMAVAGLFRIRRQRHEGYKTWLYPATPAFFLLVTAVVLMLIAVRNPLQTILGIGVTLAGLPVYYLIFAREKTWNGLDQNNRI